MENNEKEYCEHCGKELPTELNDVCQCRYDIEATFDNKNNK